MLLAAPCEHCCRGMSVSLSRVAEDGFRQRRAGLIACHRFFVLRPLGRCHRPGPFDCQPSITWARTAANLPVDFGAA
jgi:hypothetical protein